MATFIKGDPAAPEPDDGTTVVYDRAKSAYVPGPTPGGGGGGGVTVHGELTGRSAPDQHPIDAVTGLQDALDGKAATGHDHDDRYYTDAETDTALDGKADTSHQHPVSDLTATGTADETTYLRGDGTWATPEGGGGEPAAWSYGAPGAWHTPLFADTSKTNDNYTTAANVLGLVPFLVFGEMEVSETFHKISTAGAAGSFCRTGIWEMHDGRPAVLVGQSAATTAAASGDYYNTMQGGPVLLRPGRVYVAGLTHSDASGAIRLRAYAGPPRLALDVLGQEINPWLSGPRTGLAYAGVSPTEPLPNSLVGYSAATFPDDAIRLLLRKAT